VSEKYELISSGIEWFTTPDTVEVDIEPLRAKVAEWAETLKAAGLDYGVKWYAGVPYEFFDEDGEAYGEEQFGICEAHAIRWEGAHLKAYADGDAQLFWHVKDSDDKVWVDFRFKEEGEA
jgi:hypothetical protein